MDNEEAAVEQQRNFSCGSDKLFSYDKPAYICEKVACAPKDEFQIERFNGDLFAKAYFPFLMTDFYVAPAMAKEKLGYKGAENDLKDDLKWYYVL